MKKVSRICKDGFDKECIEEQREVYGIYLYMLSGRWKYIILWIFKTKERRYSKIIVLFMGLFTRLSNKTVERNSKQMD